MWPNWHTDYIVQGHRFDIYEDFGCVPSTYNVTLTYVLLQPPAFILPLASCIFAALSIRNFIKRDVQFNTLLSGSSFSKSNGSEGTVSNLTGSRYLRLMMLASMEIIIGFPTTLAVCIMNITILGPVNPWISWEDTHFDFWTVDRYTVAQWKVNGTSTALVEWNRWMSVVCGLLFFAFFGFAQEARRNYRKAWRFMGRCAPGVGKTFEAFSGKRESFGNLKLSSAGSSFHATYVSLTVRIPCSSTTTNMLRSSSFARFKVTTPGTGGNSSNAALPIYVEKEVINKRDSFDTFTSADLMSLRSGAGSTIMKLSSFAGPTKSDSPTSSASQSRSPSPTPRPRPRVEVTSEIYPEDSERRAAQTSLRTPETAFPRSVTPDVETRRFPPPAESSFLEMVTPAADGFSPLARVETPRAALRRGDNWV